MRIILDTCIISALHSVKPEPAVVSEVNALGEDVYISVVTISEMSFGAYSLPVGDRRTELLDRLTQTEQRFAGRTLDVDADIARLSGQVRGERRGTGIQIGLADGLIAATALHHGMAVMTRNVRHFAPTGVEVVNPWPR